MAAFAFNLNLVRNLYHHPSKTVNWNDIWNDSACLRKDVKDGNKQLGLKVVRQKDFGFVFDYLVGVKAYTSLMNWLFTIYQKNWKQIHWFTSSTHGLQKSLVKDKDKCLMA